MINRKTINVGIKQSQQLEIKEMLFYGESINSFVQEAIDFYLPLKKGIRKILLEMKKNGVEE